MRKPVFVAAFLAGSLLTCGAQAGQTRVSLYDLVTQIAKGHGVDPALAHAVVAVESTYNCAAKNPRSSATGAMQVVRGTAKLVGVHGNLKDCRTGLTAGMRYLKQKVDQTGGNACAAATAYYLGSPGGCNAYGRKVVAAMRSPLRIARL